MYLVLDLETTISSLYNKCPNPYFQRILCYGFKEEHKNFPDAFSDDKLGERFTALNPSLVIGHNLKYDLLHIWKEDWCQKWLLDGGKIWDTQLVEYILTGQQAKYSALRKLAVEKYNRKERPKNLEDGLAAKMKMEDMPIEWLLDDVTNDVADTEAIYLKQLETARDQKQLTLIHNHMDALLATTEMQVNGMYVNQEILQTNKANLEAQLDVLRESIGELIKPYWEGKDVEV
jgi:DNA polymerase I-like protein with 3'-5' exonuclease and polymerase domains